MASNSKEAANAQFKKAQRAQEGTQGRAQYETDARAVREKTTRLRSLRLAKEAAEMEIGVKHTTSAFDHRRQLAHAVII